MKRNVLLLPLLIFLLTAEALLWQLVCNALGDDPAAIESALTQGKTVLLNVWVLNQLSVQGIMVVGLNYKDNLQKTVTWLRELGNPYVLSLFDGDGDAGTGLGGVWRSRNLPHRRERNYPLPPYGRFKYPGMEE